MTDRSEIGAATFVPATRWLRSLQVPVVASLLFFGSGCSILSLAAGVVTHPTVPAVYTKLAGQSMSVMVAADRGTQLEYSRIQLDMAESLNSTLKMTQNNKAEELKGTTFPDSASPRAIFAFQRNYPQYEWEPIVNLAPKFGVTRLLHIEVDSLTLHPDNVPELFRGVLTARVQIVEVTGNTAKIAFEDRVTANFPSDSPSTGLPTGSTAETYRGTIQAFSAAVIERFVAHPSEDN